MEKIGKRQRAQGSGHRAQSSGQKKSDGMNPSPGTGVMLAI